MKSITNIIQCPSNGDANVFTRRSEKKANSDAQFSMDASPRKNNHQETESLGNPVYVVSTLVVVFFPAWFLLVGGTRF